MVPWVQGRPGTLGPSVFRSYDDVVDMVQLSRGPPSATEVNVDDLPISPGMLASDDPDSPGPVRPVRPQGRAAGESDPLLYSCCALLSLSMLHINSAVLCMSPCRYTSEARWRVLVPSHSPLHPYPSACALASCDRWWWTRWVWRVVQQGWRCSRRPAITHPVRPTITLKANLGPLDPSTHIATHTTIMCSCL